MNRGVDVVPLLESLVRIPSVNPSLAPEDATGEGAIAAFIRDWLVERGVPAVLEEAAPGRPNVVGTVGRAVTAGGAGAGAVKTLVLCAHTDTVGTAGMTIPPFEPRREGDRLYGRGAFDMKGGLAAVMTAGARLQQEWSSAPGGAPGTVLLVLVADEEYTSLGADHFVAHHKADACILTESSEGDLIVAHKGFVWLTVRTRGHAAHGSRWDLGRSAIGAMARVVDALERFDRETLRARVHPLVGPASMHCAMIQGGVGISTYAPECALRVERRTLPGETPEQVAQEIRALAASVGETADVAIDFSRPSLLCDPKAPIAHAMRGAIEKVAGAAPKERGVWYWMDAAIFAAAGIDAVDYGPIGSGAHEAVEWVDVTSVEKCAEVLVESARRYFAV
ncbi:MAG TPA: M20/M25/M40 family metallo-hydrolase [Candidatus Eisenbacteria bacterium]|nr:M20/M25/M40 family metallo-hydrolase [Candidatus Eisenbacteria bacterium]